MDLSEDVMVVLHVDLDCFYAAVEQLRLGISKDQPLAVQQWDGLIAVNYPARAAGIARHERINEALKKCPNLVRVHVETIGREGENEGDVRRESSKVSLERYRQASSSVFGIFQQFSEICEKASIDEAYLDVTTRVEEMVTQDRDWQQELQRLTGPTDYDEGKPTMVVMDGPLVPYNSFDRRLLAGAIIAEELRSAVRNQLGYTCSVGIATNKLLAKIASSRNKPDGQTLVPPRAVPGLMKDLPIRKVKLLGGKLGQDLQQVWHCTTAGEAQDIPLAALVGKYGERLGNYVWKAVRGIQTSKVETKQIAKSMLAAKTFAATSDMPEIQRWIHILAEELSVRVFRDALEHRREPKILQLYFRSGHGYSCDRSKSCPVPQAALQILSSGCKQYRSENADSQLVRRDTHNDLDGLDSREHTHFCAFAEEAQGLAGQVNDTTKALAKVLETAGLRLFHRSADTLPCHRLALAASGFQQSETQGTKPLEHFFSALPTLDNAGRSWAEEQTARLPVKVPQAKPKGILKYVSTVKESPFNVPSAECPVSWPSILSRSECDNAVVPSTSTSHPSNSDGTVFQLSLRGSLDPSLIREVGCMIEDDRPGDASLTVEPECGADVELDDQSVDLEHVDLDEQRRILERIHRLKAGNRKHTRDLKLENRGGKRRQSLENGQESITKFFRSGAKTSP